MEDKLKKVLDSLDEKETDRLLGKIKESDAELDADRIMKQVYERTGISGRKVIPWKKVAAIAGLAASFLIVFICGYMLRGSIGSKTELDGSEQYAADNIGNDSAAGKTDEDKNTVSEEDGSEDIKNDGETEDEDLSDKSSSSSDNDSDKKDDKKDKEGKEDKHNKKDSKGDSIAVGTDIDSVYLNMTSEEIEGLLEESAEDIDMNSDISGYASLEDMIDHVDYIVRGVKVSSVLRKGSKKRQYILASEFKINDVILNNLDKDIDDKIIVEEGIVYKSKKEKYIHVCGYNRMKTGNEYVLFIKKSGKKYSIAETIFGKVPVAADEDVLYLDKDYVPSQTIISAKNIIEDAREKYIEGSDTADQDDKKDKTDNSDKTDSTDKTENSDNSDKTENNEDND